MSFLFRSAIPFREALESRVVRTLLPTDLRTDLLQTLTPQIRQRAIFSAGVQQAENIQFVEDMIGGILRGEITPVEARERVRQFQGIPTEEIDESDLTDIRSEARVNLRLDMGVRQAAGMGRYLQAQRSATHRQLWPAWELIRIREAEEPRPWEQIWADAINELGSRTTATFYAGRMLALKGDPIWEHISRFGHPYPPFDYGSGMGVEEVDRETAVAALLMSEDAEVVMDDLDFNEDLQASPEVRSASLREAVAEALQGVARFDADGVLRAIGGGA